MAEAVVEERTVLPMRYFCHMCNVEINIPNTDIVCPLCAGGFVEELPTAQPAHNAASNNADLSGSRRRDERLADLNALRDDLTTFLMSRNGQNFEISFGDDGNNGHMIVTGGAAGRSNNDGRSGNDASSSNTSIGGGRVRPHDLDRLDNVLFDFLHSLSVSDLDTPFGNSQLFFMGNPGDYAWGREGIDTIVTQLLNQMETSGPPPLAKDKIDDIPKVNVSAEEVEKKQQCSVCWEDFQLAEEVRRLPCSHIYHENCIVPWLNLHSTCPICRKSLIDEETEQAQAPPRNSGGGVNRIRTSRSPIANITLGALMRPNNPTTNAAATPNASDNNSSNSGVIGNSTTSQGHGNVFGFDDSNMDLDMDLD